MILYLTIHYQQSANLKKARSEPLFLLSVSKSTTYEVAKLAGLVSQFNKHQKEFGKKERVKEKLKLDKSTLTSEENQYHSQKEGENPEV